MTPGLRGTAVSETDPGSAISLWTRIISSVIPIEIVLYRTHGDCMSRCLAAGSMLRVTPFAEVAVEDIQESSEIITSRNGIETAEPVRWVGRRHLDLTRHTRPEEVAPVRIRAGAVAERRPSRDLLVSPEHAILVDNVLIQARALINGGSIVQERATSAVTYYHIELESHGVVFANDLAVESYLDNGDRSFFEDGDHPLMLHPTQTPSASDRRNTDAACAPFVTDPAAVEPVWRRLAQRSRDMGYARADILTTADANLHIVANGKVIRPTTDGNGRHLFIIPAGASTASLVSNFAIPADDIPYAGDLRRLGFAVSSITIQSDGTDVVIPPDFPTDAPGWHDPEREGAAIWRWTDGAAVLPLGELKAFAIVTISGRSLDRYPLYDERACPLGNAA